MEHCPVSIFAFRVSRFIFIPFTNLRYQSKNSHQNTSLCQCLSSTFLDTSLFSANQFYESKNSHRPHRLLTPIFLAFPKSFLFDVLRIVPQIISVTRLLAHVWVKKRRKERGTPSIHAT